MFLRFDAYVISEHFYIFVYVYVYVCVYATENIFILGHLSHSGNYLHDTSVLANC